MQNGDPIDTPTKARQALREIALWACRDICIRRGRFVIDNAAAALRMTSIASARGLNRNDLMHKAGFGKHHDFVAFNKDLFEEQDQESGGHVRFLGISSLDPKATPEFASAHQIVEAILGGQPESVSLSQIGLRLKSEMSAQGFPEPVIPPGFKDLSHFLTEAGYAPALGRISPNPDSGSAPVPVDSDPVRDPIAPQAVKDETVATSTITPLRGTPGISPPTHNTEPTSPSARIAIQNTNTARENAAPKHDSNGLHDQVLKKSPTFEQALAAFLAERGATLEQVRLLAPAQASVPDAMTAAIRELGLGDVSPEEARLVPLPGSDPGSRGAAIAKTIAAWARMGHRLAVVSDAASMDRKLGTILGRKPTYADRPRWVDAPKRIAAKFGMPVQCFFLLRFDRIPESEQWVNELRTAGWTVLPARYRRSPEETFRDDDDLAIGDLLDKLATKPEYDILLLSHDARENSAGGSNAERLRKMALDPKRRVMIGAYEGYIPSSFNRLRESGQISIFDVDRDLGLHDMPVPRQPAPAPVSESTDFDQIIGSAPIIGAR